MKKLLLISMAWMLFLSGYGQERRTRSADNEVWVGFTLKKQVSDRVTLSLDQQTRTMDNLEGIRANFLELGMKYELSKHFAVKGQYRYTIRNNSKNTERLSLDLSTKWKYKPAKLTFKYRLRFQNSVVEYTGQNITYLRNRFTMQYKISKKWQTYVEYESFFKFNQKNEFRGNRYTLGAKYRISKQMNINAFYQIDQEINVKHAFRENIFGVILQWEI
ncbi:DUF2490 domain-containing protein [bacterium SCSIO 12643]|nr:DUF2490 domain-containing protein [bacterium SCSIO 12643]